MKRSIISIFLLAVLGALVYMLWVKFGQKEQAPVIPVVSTEPSKVATLLSQSSINTGNSGQNTEVAIDNLSGLAYAGGGEYKQFFPQTVKQALTDGKSVILYFYADRDPTDKALDIDLQRRLDRIPANTIIMRIDYDTNQKLRDAFSVKEQNTLIYLNDTGTEKMRRSKGITSLSQIVRALQ